MKTRHLGFSLIELLVAIVISLVGFVAATETYMHTRQTYRLQNMQSRLTEDGRFAISMLQRVISQAGFRPNPTTTIDPNRMSITNNVITLKFTADGNNQISCDGSLSADGVSQTLVIKKTGNKLQCDSVDWITPAAAGAGNGTELVDFNVTFGLDTGPASTPSNFGCGFDSGTKPRDCIADSYVDALGGASAEQIVSTRVCIVLRSEAFDGSVVKPAAVQDCAANNITNSQTDKKLYRTFWSTISLRNR